MIYSGSICTTFESSESGSYPFYLSIFGNQFKKPRIITQKEVFINYLPFYILQRKKLYSQTLYWYCTTVQYLYVYLLFQSCRFRIRIHNTVFKGKGCLYVPVLCRTRGRARSASPRVWTSHWRSPTTRAQSRSSGSRDSSSTSWTGRSTQLSYVHLMKWPL